MKMITLRNGLAVGSGAPVRVNCNIGCNTEKEYASELQKIEAIKVSGSVPDMMMDLSLIRMHKPLYLVAQEELNVETGTVLSYIPFSKANGLQWEICKDYLYELCENGISFITIHFTASRELFELAKKIRKIPSTSRGGAMCLYDSINNDRDNIFMQHIDEIAEISKQSGVAISLGSTFRPANIFDACDEAHIKETKAQLDVCHYLHRKGVKVIVENIGHIGLDKLENHSDLLKQFDAAIMPLGPLATDDAIGMDHVNNAIGAAFAAYWGCAHVINAVTRQEHTGAHITSDDTIEAICSARLAAHAVNVAKGMELEKDKTIVEQRTHKQSCLVSDGVCTRCNDCCPLKILNND